jgi:hypothetical protein
MFDVRHAQQQTLTKATVMSASSRKAARHQAQGDQERRNRVVDEANRLHFVREEIDTQLERTSRTNPPSHV